MKDDDLYQEKSVQKEVVSGRFSTEVRVGFAPSGDEVFVRMTPGKFPTCAVGKNEVECSCASLAYLVAIGWIYGRAVGGMTQFVYDERNRVPPQEPVNLS